ncbi:MAG: tetratricopeptide repeat protein [Desulfobacteraceae bacterium]|nr:MAG: tetratricopeptide repeat protein [Desulfobacteraceae bacterium]
MIHGLKSSKANRSAAPVAAVCLLLAVSSFWVYWPVTTHSFLNYDDQDYVTENPHVRSGLSLQNVMWALNAFHSANWHPLTWISHMLDVELFGLNPGMHHLVNLILHVLNTLFLFLLLRRMTREVWPSFLVAALFSLHPVHVESVAWIAERKDVLSTLFGFSAIWAYLRYAGSPNVYRYLWIMFFFILGLSAKPMLVTLPFWLLLIDWWPLKRFSGSRSGVLLVQEKAPLLVLALLTCWITLLAQSHAGAIKPSEAYPFSIRIANALVSYAAYLVKMVWPSRLTAYYPHPGSSLSMWKAFWALLILISITVTIWRFRGRHPRLWVGWLWYIGTLFPVIGMVQVGSQAFADRYTYVPFIGLFIMVSYSLSFFKSRPLIPISVFSVILVILMVQTRIQLRCWQNDMTLFRHMLNVTENNYRAHFGMGLALVGQGLLDQAAVHYREAIRINPDSDRAYNNMGLLFLKKGDARMAAIQFGKALQLKETNAKAHNNMGVAMMAQGKTEQALSHFHRAISLNPGYTEARKNLATASTTYGLTKEIGTPLKSFSESMGSH